MNTDCVHLKHILKLNDMCTLPQSLNYERGRRINTIDCEIWQPLSLQAVVTFQKSVRKKHKNIIESPFIRMKFKSVYNI